MARITDNTSEYLTALDFSFAGREPFTSDPTFDFLLQRFRSDTTTSWDQLEINIPPNLHKFTEEINRDTHQIYNHHSDSKVQSENKDRRRISSDSPLLCKWSNCKRPGPFSNRATLKRHVDTQHLDPRSFKCHSCNMSFNRKDNLDQHLRADFHRQKSQKTR
ncbi:Zinc finger C2H2 [Penicillium manginii]|uniref:Zinc finger C2H2 n=1 Tax=Penicillium manginii TaxID=203109 RepID=UPI0025484D68|nr:Zinc finger C2H2 [Penicillium manginii]KAJ5743703.1 Zinc finger C2H2 [Penicillium manginii]